MEFDLTVHVAVPDRLLILLERIAVALTQVGGTLGMTGVPDDVARRRGIPVIWTEERRALLAAQAPYPAGPRVGQLRQMLNALPGPKIATDKAVAAQRTYMRAQGLMPAAAPAVRPEAETVQPARPALQPIAETMPPGAEASAPPRRVVSERLRLGVADGQRGLGGTDQAAGETRPAIPPALATRDGAISTAALEQLRADPGEAVAMAWDDILEWGRRWAPEVINAGGSRLTVIAALNRHEAREGLPPIRLGKNLFGTHGALPSERTGLGEKVV